MFARVKAACDRSLAVLHKLEWIGPLAVRVTLGSVFVTTGWGKLHGLDDVTQYFASLGIPASHAQAVLVSLVEFVGGLLLVLGLGTRVAATLLVGVMAVAIWTAKLPEVHGIADLAGTVEVAYLVAFVWLLVSGGGVVSIDRLLMRRSPALTPVG
ncbi:MAG: DoxX family protein [Kofleriaceae bacterium]